MVSHPFTSCLLQQGDGKTSGKEADDLEDDLENEEDTKQPLRTTFELSDTLYAEAELEDTDLVYLWLGVRVPLLSLACTHAYSPITLFVYFAQANVMLSYKIPEAITLLTDKMKAAETNLTSVEEDLEFTREQITIMEVNTARIYNWDVKRRREKRLKEEGKI